MNPHNPQPGATGYEPFLWHTRPARARGNCPVCGCPPRGTRNSQPHRAIGPEEGIPFRFLVLPGQNQPCAPVCPAVSDRAIPVDSPRVVTPERKAPADSAPAPLPEPSLDWTWPQFWRHYVKPRMRRQVANHGRRRRGIEPYREAVQHWKRFSGNPTLGATTREHCDSFIRRLFRLPGRRGPKTALFQRRGTGANGRAIWLRVKAPENPADVQSLLGRQQRDYRLMAPIRQNTVHKLCAQMETIFHWAGPESKRFPEAVDLFSGLDAQGRSRRLPWLNSPKTIQGDERVFRREELLALLRVCHHAIKPSSDGLTPETWWRALIEFIYYTGLRIGTALAARYDWITIDDGVTWLNAPADRMKGKRPEPICLQAEALAALESLRRPGREVIFAWPRLPSGSNSPLYREFERLQELAGIPPQRRFRFHAIRACAGDALFALDPKLAKDALCHRDLRTTEAHYTRAETRRARLAAMAAVPKLAEPEPSCAGGATLDAMPQPFEISNAGVGQEPPIYVSFSGGPFTNPQPSTQNP